MRPSCSKVHLFEGPVVRKFEQVNLRTTGPSNNCALHFSNNWAFEQVGRPSCSKAHLFKGSLVQICKFSNNWAFEQVGRPSCSKAHLFKGSYVQICKFSNKWAFEQVGRLSCSKAHLFEGSLVRKFNCPSCSKMKFNLVNALALYFVFS